MKATNLFTAALLACGLAACTALPTTTKNAMETSAQPAEQAAAPDNGLLTGPSDYSAAESLQRIQAALAAKGLTVFAVLDHQAAAQQVQLEMPAASVIVFGNPRLGTPMMVQTPSLAIDLPSKALVWEDAQGQVFVTLNTAEYLGLRHSLPADNVQALKGLEKLVLGAVKKAP